MATIEELERQSAEIAEAEGDAVLALVEVMRELAVRLPAGSEFAVRLARLAKNLEIFATGRDPAPASNLALQNFARNYIRNRNQAESA